MRTRYEKLRIQERNVQFCFRDRKNVYVAATNSKRYSNLLHIEFMFYELHHYHFRRLVYFCLYAFILQE